MIEPTPLPEDITSPSKIEATSPIGEDHQEVGGNKQSFASLMENKEQTPALETQTHAISPFDLASAGMKPTNTPNVATLTNQANHIHSTFGTLQTQLSDPNLQLKSSQKYLVKNKLTDANASIRAANAKLGIPPSETPPPLGSGPIAQYLGYVADGVNQIESTKKELASLSARGGNLAPADFMLTQLKLNKAQQETDFCSVLLAKSIEGFKMIMNIQI